MEEDVMNALLSRAAYLPGGFDRDGRILVVVSILSDSQLWNRNCMETCISYIRRLLSPDLLKKGVTVVVDAQRCSSRITRAHSRLIYSLFGDTQVTLLLVRPEGFWEKHVESCAKSHTKGEPIVVSRSRLVRYIETCNLPEELGGTLSYSHDLWLQNRKAIDDFRKTFDRTIHDMENLHVLLLDSKSLRPSDADKELKQCAMIYSQVQTEIAETVDTGNRLLTRIADTYRLQPTTATTTMAATAMPAATTDEQQHSPGTPSSSNAITPASGANQYKLPPDMANERARTEQLLSDIQKKQSDIRSAWRDLEQTIHEAREVAALEEGVAFVTNWILNTAEQMLNRKQTIGCDVKACEELRRQHENLEMECRETYGFYAELLYKIESYSKVKGTASLAFKDLMSQRDFMNFVCRSFATRLERRRNILITSLRFYRLVTDYFDRTTSVFESLVMGNKVEDFESAAVNLQKLKDSQVGLEALEKELIKEGEKLSDMLAMPVKDALGRDLRIDYSEDIVNVRDILDTTIARRNIFIDSVELQKLTLEQVTHIHTYESDSRMAIKWMDDLYSVMIKCHSHVGCNVHEIQVQKDELQTFQETGKSIYHYGCQLLEASQALRTSCKLDTEASKTMSNQLRCTWHNLQTISQEHLTRLRVSAVFHRSVEEYCNKLHDLKISVCSLSEIEDADSRRSRLRKYLALRERLLVEVGRMVRLGRLLKTRLREPFVLDDRDTKCSEAAAASTATATATAAAAATSAAVSPSENGGTGAAGEEAAPVVVVYPTGKNEMASTAITNKLTEIAEVAEALDAALRDTQNGLDLVEMNASSAEKKVDHGHHHHQHHHSHMGNSSEDWHSRSTEDESFATASEGNFTPHSHSSSFQTASEGHTPSFLSFGKTSFDSSDIEDTNSQILPLDMLSPGNTSFDGSSDPSYVSAQQSLTTSPQSIPPDSGIESTSEFKSIAEEKNNRKHNDDDDEDDGNTHSRSATPTPGKRNGNKESQSPTTSDNIVQPESTSIRDNPDQAAGTTGLANEDESPDRIFIKVVELEPRLTTLGENIDEAVGLQRQHDETLRKVQNLPTPLDEFARKADKLLTSKRISPDLITAMADTLHIVWDDVVKLLHDRKHLLDLCANFHEKMGSCRGKMASLEVACKDTMIPIEVEAVQEFLNKFKQLRIDVLTTVMAALKDGNELLTQLQHLAKQQTLDTRPDHIKRDALRAVNQVQQWLEALHDRRNALDQAWQTRKTQLEQCLALAILAKDLDDIESILMTRRNELSGVFSLGECEHTSGVTLQQYHDLKQNALLLRDRALKITCAEEKLVSSGCFAGDEARSRAYAVLGGCTEYLDVVEQREHWLMQSKDFFGKAEKTLAVLEKLEIELSTVKFPTNTPESFVMFSKILRDMRGFTEEPLRLGYGILDEVGRTKPETQGVKRVLDEIENRKIYIEGICSESTEEQVRVEQALNDFLEQYNQLLAWLVSSDQNFLQKSVSLGRNLQESRRFLLHHHELMQHLEDKGEHINNLLETIKSHLESLSPQQRYDVDSKAESLHKHWIELKDIVLKRVDIVSLLIEFYEKADKLDNEYFNLEKGLEQVSDEKKLRFMQDSWAEIKQSFAELKDMGAQLINLKIVDPYLETKSLRSDVEDTLNSFSSRQIDVTTSLENLTTQIAEKREVEIILEKIMNDNEETASRTTKVDTQLYPIFTSPSVDAEYLLRETKQKLAAVVNDIEQAQDEIEQRVLTTLGIQTKDVESLQKIDQVISNLRTLKGKLDGIKYDYKTLVESAMNFVENVIQLRQQIDEHFAVQKSKFPDNSCEKIDRVIADHERFRENCMDKFRSLITQSELLIDRVRALEPLGAREVDTDRILKLLENLRIHFESTNGARMSDLDRLEKLESFRSDLYEINRSLDSVSQQLNDINGQNIDSLASAKTTSLAFEYFERTIELLEKRITSFTETSQSLYSSNPDSEQFVRDELKRLEDKWRNFKEQVKAKRNSLNSATDFFEIVEKIEAEYREINYFYTSVTNKISFLRDPVEASNLVNDIETYVGAREGRLRDSLDKAQQSGHDGRRVVELQTDVLTLFQSFVKLKTDISLMQERMKVEERLREQQEQAAKEQAERERLAREQAERDRLAREQAERERIAWEKAEMERLSRELAERERLANELAERERLAREQAEKERIAWEQNERERLTKEFAERERIAREQAERERLAWEQERERFAKEQAERDRLAREQAEREFAERERLAREQAQREYAERERQAWELAEKERVAREQTLREIEERERLAREQAEKERLAREQALRDIAERERLAREEAERERIAREQAVKDSSERERLAREQAERERLAREQIEREYAERERILKERSEIERIAREKEEKERIIREQTETITIIKDHTNNDQVAQSANIEDIRKEKQINEMFTEIKYAPPRFTVPLSDAVTKEGDRFTFKCEVTGNPTPAVEWYKDGILIHNNPDYKTALTNEGICTLVIEETFVADSARFSCRASNLVGVTDTTATLSVKENPAEAQMTPPRIVQFLQSGKATEGSSFEFVCTVTGNPLPTVQWYKNDKCIDDSPDYVISYNNGEAKLRFEEVFLEDDAIYTCSASNQVGLEHCSASLIVEPLEPTEVPHFKIPLTNVMGRVGQKIKLEALVGGIPRPDIYWTHNGKPYAPRDVRYEYGRVTLMIPEAYPNDSGVYVLTAKNLAGEAYSSCNVMVKGRLPNETSDSEMASDMEPIKPSVQLPLKDVSIFEGKSVRLDCVIVGQPEPEVIWYHDERPVKESADVQLLFQGDRCSLLIQEVYQEDAGHYKVVAINSAGEASSSCELKVTPLNIAEPATRMQSESVSVSVDRQPKFEKFLSDVLVAEGDPVEMECVAIGDQPLQAKWYLSNKELEASERIDILAEPEKGIFKLVFKNVSVDDKGVYTVKVFNKSGDAKCFSHLIVKSVNAPDNQRVQQVEIEEKLICPTFKELFNDKVGHPGEVIKFECIVKGKPTPKIRWFFNDQPVHGKNFLISTSGDRQVLTIPEASPETVGKICCVAENETGKATCIAHLHLIGSGVQPSSVADMQQSTQEHNTETSRVTIKKQTYTTTSTSQVNSYEGNMPQMEVHTSSAHIDQSLKQLGTQRPEIVESHHYQEFHKTNDLPPSTQQKSIAIVQSASEASPKSNRKQIAPRFTTPLTGKIVDQGTDVFLEAIYDGFPSPEIKIHKNGAELFEGDKTKITNKFNRVTIDLKQVGVSDAGRYSVMASNSMGQSTSTADLVVKKTIFPPVFGHRLQAQVAKRGERIIMEVEVTGTPDPTVTWLRDERPLKDVGLSEHRVKSVGNTHTLIIEKAEISDSGKFMVKATNAGGEAKSIADCVIVEPTPEKMVEVVKTLIYDDSKDVQVEPFKPEPPGFQTNQSSVTTESDLHGTSESKIITEHRCTTAATMRLEHKAGIFDVPTLQSPRAPTVSTATDAQRPDLKSASTNTQPSQMQTDSTQTAPQAPLMPYPTPTGVEESQTETTSVSKKSSLEYFKKIEIQHQQQQQLSQMPKPPSNEKYTKFEEVAKTSTPQLSIPPTLEMDLKNLNLVPGSPPEICYVPKVDYQKPQIAEKIKKIEQSQLIMKEPPMGGIPILPQMSPILEETSRSSSFVRETKVEYGQPILRPAATLPTPSRSFNRSPSPKPSAEGLRMEKLWTPTPSQNGGYESYQSDLEQGYKTESDCEVPKTLSQTKQIFEEKIKEYSKELSAPSLVKQVASRPVPVVTPKQDPLPDIQLVPGSPPEICFAPQPQPQHLQPEPRRPSLVEAMEKSLELDLLRGPSKVLPHSVPTMLPHPQAQIRPAAPPKPIQIDVPKVVKPPPPVVPPKLVRSEFSESEYESDRWKYSGSESDESCFKPVKVPQVVGVRPKSMEMQPPPLKVSGYTADTEELSSRKFESVYESRQFFESKHHSSSTQQYQNGFASSPIREHKDFQKSSIISDVSYTAPPKPKPAQVASPSKFTKGDVSDYSSEVDERFRSVSRTYESDSEIKGYRVVHPPTPTQSDRRSNISNGHKSPLPPMEFELPQPMQGPGKPKFEPIKQEHYQKTQSQSQMQSQTQTQTQTQKQKLFKPKPVAAKFIEATQASAPPKTTMYYTAVTGAPMHLAKVATETKNTMQMKESTETCQRIVNMQQTKRVIHFDSSEQKQRSETPLEPFPYTVTSPSRLTPGRQSVPPPGTPTRFIPGEFRESDYESEVEGARIRPLWTPKPLDGEPRYRHVEPPQIGGGRCTSLPRTYERVLSPMEFDRGPEMPSKIQVDTQNRQHQTQTLDRYSSSSSSKKTYQRHVTQTTRDDMNLQVGSPPKYGYIQNQASSQAKDMGTTFLQKHHKFVNDITSDLRSAPAQGIRPGFKRAPSEGTNKPEAYRNESRVSQYGTKCVDPNTGLIYFKYDFGYEFGILFPGEGRKFIGGKSSVASSSNSLPAKKPATYPLQNMTGEIVIPIQHERTTTPTYQYPHKYVPQKRRSLPTIEINIDRLHANDSALPNLRTVQQNMTVPDQPSDVPVNSHLIRDDQSKKAPIFITPLKDIAAVVGKTARFECIVQSDPNTSIAWMKNGYEIQCSNQYVIEYRNGVCRLTIPQAYPDDSGIYSCSATNPLGTAITQAQLSVPGNNRGTRF